MNGLPGQPPFNTTKGQPPFNTTKGYTTPRVSKRPATNLSKFSINNWIRRFLLESPTRTTMVNRTITLIIIALSMFWIFLYISRTLHNS